MESTPSLFPVPNTVERDYSYQDMSGIMRRRLLSIRPCAIVVVQESVVATVKTAKSVCVPARAPLLPAADVRAVRQGSALIPVDESITAAEAFDVRETVTRF